MEQQITRQDPMEFKKLDAVKIDVLRGQLRDMIAQGDVGKMMAAASDAVAAPAPDHTSHTSDGW